MLLRFMARQQARSLSLRLFSTVDRPVRPPTLIRSDSFFGKKPANSPTPVEEVDGESTSTNPKKSLNGAEKDTAAKSKK